MRNFALNAIKGGRCNAFSQHYKSEILGEVFIIISKKLNVKGNECDILEKYFEFLNKREIHYATEFDSKYDDYRDIDQEEKTDYVYKNLTCNLFIKSCLNLIQIKLKWISMQRLFTRVLCGMKIRCILK